MAHSVVSKIYESIYKIRKLRRAKVSTQLVLTKYGNAIELELTLYGEFAMHRGIKYIRRGNIWEQK